MESSKLMEQVLGLCEGSHTRENTDRPGIWVPATALRAVMRILHDEPSLRFTILFTHTAMDWLEQGTFELIYLLHSPEHNLDLVVSTSVARENPVVPTVSDIWPVAQWQEREVYDMFGVRYEHHPDLRRLLLDDEWIGFPLRRDYSDSFMLEKPV